MAGVRAVADTGALWRATGIGDTEYREAGEAKEVRDIVSTGARWWRTKVLEVGWDTRTGAVGSLAGAGAYWTRVSEAHYSEFVTEKAGTGAVQKMWTEARAQDVVWAWAQNVGRTGDYTGTKYCGKAECEHCVGTQTKVGMKVFLIVNLTPHPSPSTASTGRPPHQKLTRPQKVQVRIRHMNHRWRQRRCGAASSSTIVSLLRVTLIDEGIRH